MSLALLPVNHEHFSRYRSAFCHVLRACVEQGAALGFVLPLSSSSVEQYWDDVHASLADAQRWLWVATVNAEVVGSVQLELATKANARHRCELQKLMVHPQWRRRGIGQALISKAEQVALARGRTLITLDTACRSDADKLYPRLGYQEAGRVPDYFYSTTGALDTTVIYYKHLASAPPLVA